MKYFQIFVLIKLLEKADLLNWFQAKTDVAGSVIDFEMPKIQIVTRPSFYSNYNKYNHNNSITLLWYSYLAFVIFKMI